MSVKGTTYKEITDHLKATVPAIQWVDKDRGQLEDAGNFVFPRPAVFVSFGLGQYESQGGGILKGDKILRVRTCYENYADSFTGSLNQEKALAYFEFDEAVHKALEGFNGTHFQGLTKISDEDDLDHTNLIVQVLEYTMNITDDSAATKNDFVLIDPDPTLKVARITAAEMNALKDLNVNSPVILPGS